MTSEKLRKYLAYYQKTLREEPENIEARLRLASIFREMGRIGHAVEEYVNASKLLAREGLPLEAIAACKAVLELEPGHTETQMFLARLFAQVPDATGVTARVARPMETDLEKRTRRRKLDSERSAGVTTAQASDAWLEDGSPITLDSPKEEVTSQDASDEQSVDGSTRKANPDELPDISDIDKELGEDDTPTTEELTVHQAVDEQTRNAHEATPAGLSEEQQDVLLNDDDGGGEDGATVEMSAMDRDEVVKKGESGSEDLRTTTDFDRDEVVRAKQGAEQGASEDSTLRGLDAQSRDQQDEVDLYSDEFRGTQDVAEEDIIEAAPAPEPEPGAADKATRSTQDVEEDSILGEEVVDEEELRSTNELSSDEIRRRRSTQRLSASPRGRKMTSQGLPASKGADNDEETFEIGVFDMDSLGLENTSTDWDDLSFLDDIEGPDSDDVRDYEVDTGEFGPAVLSVARSELPEIPLFSQLSPELFAEMLGVIEVREFSDGEVIASENTERRSLWVIVQGRAAVSKELDDGTDVELAELGEGDFFGEFYLLTGRTGEAMVTASGDLAVFEISEAVIEELAKSNPEIWDILWDFYYSRMLNNMLATSDIFRSLDREERTELAEKFELVEFARGQQVLGQGERDDDLYLICNGVIRVEAEAGSGERREIDTLREGEFLGLISSAEEKPVAANLTSVEDCSLLVLSGDVFRQFMAAHPAVRREVEKQVRERKANAGRYTSGVTSYAELGLASSQDDTSD